eukprot:COSAG05_NODE_876_length_6817_cov_6650.697827_5_plen_50_part_00
MSVNRAAPEWLVGEALLVGESTAKRKAKADVGTSTGSLPYYTEAWKKRW